MYGPLGQEQGVELELHYGGTVVCGKQRDYYDRAGWLFQRIEDPDRYALAEAADFGGEPDRTGRINAILSSQGFDTAAWALAYHLAGGEDCEVTTTEGRQFVDAFIRTEGIYVAGSAPQPPTTTVPGAPTTTRPVTPVSPFPTVPTSTGMPGWMIPAIAIGIFAVMAGGKAR